MPTIHFASRYLRLVLCCIATTLSVAFCVSQGHVHVTLRNPATWSNPLQHRCGCLMLFCMACTAMEMMATMLLAGKPIDVHAADLGSVTAAA